MKKTLLFTLCLAAFSATPLFAKNCNKKSKTTFNFELHINTPNASPRYEDPYFSPYCARDLEPIYVVAPKRPSPCVVVVNQAPQRPIYVIDQQPTMVFVRRPIPFWWY
jgi:hypothetical protein